MRTWSVRAMFRTGLRFAVICFSPFTLFSQSTSGASSGAAALAPYGSVGVGPGSLPCQAPSNEGVTICEPPGGGQFDIPSPFQVIAAGTSGRGQVKLMELWADGKKVAQTDGTPFDEPVSLDAGNHTLILVEQDAHQAAAVSAIVAIEPRYCMTLAPIASTVIPRRAIFCG